MKSPTRKPCRIRNCRRTVGPAEHSDKCHKHRLRAWREKHPIAYAFGNLKRRARGRGVVCTLTLAEYAEFAEKNDLMKLRGKSSMSLSVDRIEASLGYHRWNLQAITLRENSRKSWVPYFNGGLKLKHLPSEIRRMDVEYRTQCEALAERLGKTYQKGTENFWKVFQRLKIELFETLPI
jgi:hypothetical protein